MSGQAKGAHLLGLAKTRSDRRPLVRGVRRWWHPTFLHVTRLSAEFGDMLGRGRMVGFPGPPVQEGLVPCLGLLAVGEDVSGEERLMTAALRLVLRANLLCCFGPDSPLSGP